MDGEKMFRGSVFYELGMACDDIKDRCELWQAIMEYGLYGKEPPSKFKRDFVNIKFILNKSKKIAYLRGKAGEQHTGNQYTTDDNKRNSKSKAQKKAMEQNGTNGTKQFYSHSHSNSSNDKCMYLEYVYLSNEEYNKLVEGYGESAVKNKIEDLNNYIGQQGKDKYKSHYHALSNWLKKDGAKKITASNTTRREDGIYDLDDF